MTARLFVALPLTAVGIGIGVTAWWVADGCYRLLRRARRWAP